MRKRWECAACLSKGTCKIEVGVVFHRCHPIRQTRRRRVDVGVRTREERRSLMFSAFESAVDEDEALLRRLG